MLEISKDVYTIDNVFGNNLFGEILDEFEPRYNNWIFDKKEFTHLPDNEKIPETSTYPAWGSLYKYDNHAGKHGIGYNLKFIQASSVVQTHAEKTIRKRLRLERINTNIQFTGQEATFHTDGTQNEWTFLVFTHYFWKTEWGGEFICQTDDKKYIGVPYIPNNGVLFRADLEHRGSAPNSLCITERKTIAFTYTINT